MTAMWVSAASAQAIDPFGSIQNRFRPDYATPPINVGGFEIVPRIEAQTEYVDNLFASDVVDVDDVILSITPQVAIRDRRPDRELRLDLSGGYAMYLNNQVDDQLQLRARGDARFGLGTRTRPFFGAYAQQNDSTNRSFSEFRDTAQPLRLRSLGGNAGVEQDFGPLIATVEGRYERTQYDSDDVVSGVRIDSGFRDYSVGTGRFRLAYSVNPAQRLYAQVELNRRDFDETTGLPVVPGAFLGNRSSDGFTARVGYARQITELLLLDVSAGYLQQNFDDPTISAISTASFEASLFYSPTQLTRLQLRASRSIDETFNPFFNGLLRTEFAVAVEHELRRNLVLSTEARYTVFGAGESGESNEYVLSGQARYFVSPRWSLRTRAERFSRSGVFEGSQNRLLLAAAYNF
ncbi:outer membrane beta-barrel protein [Sphingomonas qomolangmaensis]|uniref:Outer membrane beta-barrel protein n=1 Tax=Sphingomonas qomolangmaensis TaxID=2918765 RepID=A0ABY5L9F2_9SPHN|nr:outer membrane beta-barrel protein [Sphingomonas qomolangmaensis]UUL82395.1 outer membrane beta-barrel protein [Sphingomonas qomolangmaensis]